MAVKLRVVVQPGPYESRVLATKGSAPGAVAQQCLREFKAKHGLSDHDLAALLRRPYHTVRAYTHLDRFPARDGENLAALLDIFDRQLATGEISLSPAKAVAPKIPETAIRQAVIAKAALKVVKSIRRVEQD